MFKRDFGAKLSLTHLIFPQHSPHCHIFPAPILPNTRPAIQTAAPMFQAPAGWSTIGRRADAGRGRLAAILAAWRFCGAFSAGPVGTKRRKTERAEGYSTLRPAKRIFPAC